MIRRTNLDAGRVRCSLAALPLAIQIAAEARQTAPPAAAPRSPEYFEANVRPVLAANCYDCHADEQMGGLRLDSREGLLKGGRSGPAIVPGDPDKSLLIQAVRQTRETLKMPKGGRLKPAEIDALTEWVKAGALWPAFAPRSAATALAGRFGGQARDRGARGARVRDHAGAARVLVVSAASRRAGVRRSRTASWPKTDIDRFVLARLEKRGPDAGARRPTSAR